MDLRKEIIGECFDPKAELLIDETCRPHWSQAGAIVFVTMRTADSIPADTLELWERQKLDWLGRRGLTGAHWSRLLERLSESDRSTFNKHFNRLRETCLDQCHGECHLNDPRLSRIVATSLMHFDGVRYRIGDFVVMPNHAHLLCAFATADQMRIQFDSWQHFTAGKINRAIGRQGHFWQGDPFDHLVRSPEQYNYLRRYIAENPRKARLQPGEYHLRVLR